MDNITNYQPRPQLAANPGADNVAVITEMPENVDAEENGVVKVIKHDEYFSDKAKKARKSGIKDYFRVFSYATKLDIGLVSLCCATSIGSGVAFPLMSIVFGQLVGSFTDYFVPGTTMTAVEFQAEVNRLTLYLVYLFIGKFVLSYISMLTIRITGLRISAALRLAYLRAIFAQPLDVIDTISPGKVSTRITASSNTVQLAISQHLAMLFQSLAFTIGAYVIAFTRNPLLALVASSSLPFIFVFGSAIVPPLIRIHKVTEKYHDDASAMAFEIFASIRLVVAFGAEQRLARQHEDMLRKAAENEKKAAPIMGLSMSPMMVGQYGTFAIAFWFGIKQYSGGKDIDVGTIAIVLSCVTMALMNISRVISPIVAIVKASSAATELFTTIDGPTPNKMGLKGPNITAKADITFHNVTFSYPSRPDIQILEGLDLELKAGKVTAIVGPSGSGKSTIVGLLQRWYDLSGATPSSPVTPNDGVDEPTPTAEALETSKDVSKKFGRLKRQAKHKIEGLETLQKAEEEKTKDNEPEPGPNTCTGNIKVGNTNLGQIELKWWRSQIGVVQQEPFLFNDTLYNNVAFGLSGTSYEDLPAEQKMRMVQDACRKACAEDFISKLPEGYETKVGESGMKLSGGQRQRISIARSIIKQPPILILDEATSAIDVRTERIVQQALDRVSKDRTTIVIAHRLSTIRRADKIVVLRQGKVVEQGTHEDLLKIEAGVYYGLIHAQEIATEVEHGTDDTPLMKAKSSDTEIIEEEAANSYITGATETEYKQQGLLGSFGRLLYEQRHQRVLYSLAILGILASGAVYPLQAYVFASATNVFTLPMDKLVNQGNFWAGMFGVMAGSTGLSYFFMGAACHLISTAVTLKYRQEYLDNLIHKRIAFFDDEEHSPGSLTAGLSSDPAQIQKLTAMEMSVALIAVINVVGCVIISFVYGWKLSLVGLFTAMPLILAAGYIRLRLELEFENSNAKVFETSSQFAAEAVGAFRTVLSLIMEDKIGQRYETLLKNHVSKAFSSAKYSTVVFAASDSIELACMALTFWYGGTLLASRECSNVDFFVIYQAIVQGALAAGMFFSFAPNMAQATGAANRILSMRPTQNKTRSSYQPLRSPSEKVGIQFQNVCFTYESREVPVFSNLDLQIAPGQFAALVGTSGCGKSTVISLLERFYDASSGQILFNGRDITTLDLSEYRRQISLVSQEPTLYEGTIRDNIALSVNTVADEEIKQACRDVHIHDFITSLPDGYNQRLGPKGISLSGGQKQRLSLARALLRKPKLLLLDEATSSLDSESEKIVQETIERVAQEGSRTVIAVAHRLATVQRADIIFVLGSGKVLEKGNHTTLLRKRGIYWQMCQAQALDS